MKTTDQAKREIAEALKRFDTSITIDHPSADGLFLDVLNEQPELQFYIKSYRKILYIGIGSRYKLSYANTDIPQSAVTRARTYDEFENALHACIERYLTKTVICVPAAFDIANAYNSFHLAYSGYYSNMTAIQCQTVQFPSSRVKYAIITVTYRIGRVKLSMMERQVDTEVERLSSLLFARDMLPETKAYVAHNYLAKTVEYWRKDDANPLERSYMQSAYGAFINHRCVCQGYAEAYKRLLDSQGIECYVLCGKIRGSEEYHAWNAISFNGKDFYHVDVTWDAAGDGYVSWEYFCKTDRDMTPTRIWTRKSGVVCMSSTDVKLAAKKQLATHRAIFKSQGVDSKYF